MVLICDSLLKKRLKVIKRLNVPHSFFRLQPSQDSRISIRLLPLPLPALTLPGSRHHVPLHINCKREKIFYRLPLTSRSSVASLKNNANYEVGCSIYYLRCSFFIRVVVNCSSHAMTSSVIFSVQTIDINTSGLPARDIFG